MKRIATVQVSHELLLSLLQFPPGTTIVSAVTDRSPDLLNVTVTHGHLKEVADGAPIPVTKPTFVSHPPVTPTTFSGWGPQTDLAVKDAVSQQSPHGPNPGVLSTYRPGPPIFADDFDVIGNPNSVATQASIAALNNQIAALKSRIGTSQPSAEQAGELADLVIRLADAENAPRLPLHDQSGAILPDQHIVPGTQPVTSHAVITPATPILP